MASLYQRMIYHLRDAWNFLGTPYRRLRYALVMIRRTSSPWRSALFLLWPIPWKFKIPPPLTVHEIIANPGLVKRRFLDCHWLTRLWIFKKRDTPLYALYRLYEVTTAQLESEMFEASRYIWGHQPVWPIHEFPDPRDPDPTRYALLAATVQSLLVAYNERLDHFQVRGYDNALDYYIPRRLRFARQPHEVLPDWVGRVAPLPETLVLKGKDGLPCKFPSPSMEAFNIMGGTGCLYFV